VENPVAPFSPDERRLIDDELSVRFGSFARDDSFETLASAVPDVQLLRVLESQAGEHVTRSDPDGERPSEESPLRFSKRRP